MSPQSPGDMMGHNQSERGSVDRGKYTDYRDIMEVELPRIVDEYVTGNKRSVSSYEGLVYTGCRRWMEGVHSPTHRAGFLICQRGNITSFTYGPGNS